MTKKARILVFFSLILLILILYLVLTSESVKKFDNFGLSAGQVGQPAQKQTTALSEEDYKIKIKEIFTAYEKLAKDNGFTPEKANELKNQTQNLKAPSKKFIELHTNLFIALTNMEKYLSQKYEQGKDASLEKINQLKADYDWLND